MTDRLMALNRGQRPSAEAGLARLWQESGRPFIGLVNSRGAAEGHAEGCGPNYITEFSLILTEP